MKRLSFAVALTMVGSLLPAATLGCYTDDFTIMYQWKHVGEPRWRGVKSQQMF